MICQKHRENKSWNLVSATCQIFLLILFCFRGFGFKNICRNTRSFDRKFYSDTIHKFPFDNLFDQSDLEEKRDTSTISGVSIKDFGAIGDGKHDDYKAIQTACDY